MNTDTDAAMETMAQLMNDASVVGDLARATLRVWTAAQSGKISEALSRLLRVEVLVDDALAVLSREATDQPGLLEA